MFVTTFVDQTLLNHIFRWISTIYASYANYVLCWIIRKCSSRSNLYTVRKRCLI